MRIPGYGTRHSFEQYLRTHGLGDNFLRVGRIAQPRTLRAGDVLATGQRVLQDPRLGFNSGIEVLLDRIDGPLLLAPRLPLALQIDDCADPQGFRLAQDLQPGDIIGNGDEVIQAPKIGKPGVVVVMLTGGWNGHEIDIPLDLPIALLTEVDHPPQGILEIAPQWRCRVEEYHRQQSTAPPFKVAASA